jgi:hypothetical protein
MKAVSKSVSMPEAMWESLDSHATEINEDRSDLVRRLVQAELQKAGKLPGTPAHDIRAEALSAAEIAGPDAVLKALRSVKANAAANAA